MTSWPAPPPPPPAGRPRAGRSRPGRPRASRPRSGRPALTLVRSSAAARPDPTGRTDGATDPVTAVADWLASSFPSAGHAHATVIAAWMVAVFGASVGDRLAADLTRLGHGPDGAAAVCARLAERVTALPAELRSPAGARSAPTRVTADRLDEIVRQLRVETGTLRRVVAGVLQDDRAGRALVTAVVDAAVWLAVQDLRGPVTELCAVDPDGPRAADALRCLRRLLRPCVLAHGPVRVVSHRRGARPRRAPRAASVPIPRRSPPRSPTGPAAPPERGDPGGTVAGG